MWLVIRVFITYFAAGITEVQHALILLSDSRHGRMNARGFWIKEIDGHKKGKHFVNTCITITLSLSYNFTAGNGKVSCLIGTIRVTWRCLTSGVWTHQGFYAMQIPWAIWPEKIYFLISNSFPITSCRVLVNVNVWMRVRLLKYRALMLAMILSWRNLWNCE
jgi:hypothetical protein